MAGKKTIRRVCSGQQNTQLLDGFFARTELLALAGVESLVLVGQRKETEVKLDGRPLQLCGIFALCPSELSAVEQFLHLFIGNWWLTVSYGVY